VNIAYLIWLEDLNNSIIKGQVIEMLMQLKSFLKQDSLYLVQFRAIYPFGKIDKYISLKKELQKKGIILISIPVVYSEWWFFAKWYQVPPLLIQSFLILLYLSFIKNIKILHCRSYPIMLSAVLVKKLKNVKIIFDVRSDFPEENITAGRWKADSFNFKMWKLFERFYLRNSEAVIAIAGSYEKHYKNIYKDAKMYRIPNNVNFERMKPLHGFRKEFRRENKIKEDEIVFCYCGSMGSHWSDPEFYARYIIKFRKLKAKHRFFFITNNVRNIKECFNKYGIADCEYLFVSSKYEDVNRYLSAADLGMIFMPDYKIALSIKATEYLAIGLPIICNSNIDGAREIVQKYNLGIVYNVNEDICRVDNFISLYKKNKKNYFLRCRNVAKEEFSTKNIALKYAQLYREILVK